MSKEDWGNWIEVLEGTQYAPLTRYYAAYWMYHDLNPDDHFVVDYDELGYGG